MLTRREALLGTMTGAATAAFLTAAATTPASAREPAADVNDLPRERVNLVAPPFVHAHEQIASGGPRIV